MMPQQMDQILKQSFTAQPLSRTEKAALSETLVAASLNDQQLALFRSKAFELATTSIASVDGPTVIQWLEVITKVLQPSADTDRHEIAEAWFSPHPDCPRRIQELLAEAKSTVDICVFTITDDRLTSAVLQAHRRGVKVRIITDNDKAADLGSDAEQLLQVGIALRVDRSEYHMHHKFAIFDKATLLNGSYNWTRGAALNNEENFIVINHPGLVRSYLTEFEALWSRLTDGPADPRSAGTSH